MIRGRPVSAHALREDVRDERLADAEGWARVAEDLLQDREVDVGELELGRRRREDVLLEDATSRSSRTRA
jgi:hypothetical protein